MILDKETKYAVWKCLNSKCTLLSLINTYEKYEDALRTYDKLMKTGFKVVLTKITCVEEVIKRSDGYG